MVDFLLELAEVTESKVSREELYKDDDAASLMQRGHCATAFAKIDHRTHRQRLVSTGTIRVKETK